MQLNSIYLYPNKVDVYTNFATEWIVERYRKVYNRNLKIHLGVDNRIDFQLRNSDQKSVSIDNTYLVFNIVDHDSQELIYQKDCIKLSDDLSKNLKGRYYITLTRDELLSFDPGAYQYSIVIETRTYIDEVNYTVDSKSITYTDSQYDAIGIIEVIGDVYGNIIESTVVREFNYVNPFTQGSDVPKWYESSIIDAHPQTTTPQSIHTFQIYLTNYQGSVIIQGSTEPQGATPHKWIDLETISPSSSIEYINIVGRWNWFRIKHIPISGSLDKILYR